MFCLNNFDLFYCWIFILNSLELFHKFDLTLINNILLRVQLFQLFFKILISFSLTQLHRFEDFFNLLFSKITLCLTHFTDLAFKCLFLLIPLLLFCSQLIIWFWSQALFQLRKRLIQKLTSLSFVLLYHWFSSLLVQ